MALGEGERRIDSGTLEDVSDMDGKSYGWAPRVRMSELVARGQLHMNLEMITANTLSEVALSPGCPTTPLNTVSASPPVPCFDREKQSWTLEADTASETLRVRIVFKDIHNVPRNHLRYVRWNAFLLKSNNKTGNLDPIPFTHNPYSNYYVQEEVDDGIIMETDVTVKDIRDLHSFYLNERHEVRVQIEWGESFLLFQSTYHQYDDISRVHNHQMRKEILALQAENYSLERQLFSYQNSIAVAHGTGATGATSAPAASAPAPVVHPQKNATSVVAPSAVTTTTPPPGAATAADEGGQQHHEHHTTTNHHHHHHHRPSVVAKNMTTNTNTNTTTEYA